MIQEGLLVLLSADYKSRAQAKDMMKKTVSNRRTMPSDRERNIEQRGVEQKNL